MIAKERFLSKNQLITYFLQQQYGKIINITEIGGMTNSNYKINFKNNSIVLRIPQGNTMKMINRIDEKVNSYWANKINVDESFLFIDDETGVKISKFLGGGIMLTPVIARKDENMKKVITILKRLHNSKIKFNNIFNPFEMIDKYEKILKEEKGTFFKDYNKVKYEIFKFREKINKYNIPLVPCHNDTVPENFVFNNNENLNLIDWEYSGMNDFIWDLAAHSLECEFSTKEEEKFLKIYFNNKEINKDILFRLNLYKSMQDFLWSTWSNIKIKHGEDLNEYSVKRYNRAKSILMSL